MGALLRVGHMRALTLVCCAEKIGEGGGESFRAALAELAVTVCSARGSTGGRGEGGVCELLGLALIGPELTPGVDHVVLGERAQDRNALTLGTIERDRDLVGAAQ